MAERAITLHISEASRSRGRSLLYSLSLDGSAIKTNIALSASQIGDLRDIAGTYDSLFPPASLGLVAQKQLEAIGTRLFHLWIEPHWKTLAPTLRGNDRRILWIASDQADILNLPWELLRIPERDDIGTDVQWGVRRIPWLDRQPDSTSHLRAGPLRILFMACSPRNLAELDYEREEELLARAIGSKAAFQTSDLGTYKELTRRIDDFEPHIVHLSGHGTLGRDGASFCFETEGGGSDLKSSRELGRLFADGKVQCAFVSGCEAGKAPLRNVLGGVCQGIVAGGTPLAVGWAASIVDDVSTKVAEVFYETVVRGKPVDHALARARAEARVADGHQGEPSWSLPVMYATSADARLFDRELPSGVRPELFKDHAPLIGMKGQSAQFVGRRRELQSILTKLRDGDLYGVILTGIGGAGKSALAIRLARKLQTDADKEAAEPISISCKPNKPLDPETLLNACAEAFVHAGLPDDYSKMVDDRFPIETRLRLLVGVLNNRRFVLVIDNFESTLDAKTRSIVNPIIAKFYVHLLDKLTGRSRVIFTSRFLPADVDPLPGTIAQITIGDLSEVSYLKLLFRDTTARRKYQSSPSHLDLLVRLYRVFGGTPGFVPKILELLRKADPHQLLTDLKEKVRTLAMASDGELQALEKAHEDYCSGLAVDIIYGQLSAQSQQMLNRASACVGPITLDGLSAMAQSDPERLQSELDTWIRSALTYSTNESADIRWSIYGILRAWLMRSNRSSPDELRRAHCSAGDYFLRILDDSRLTELNLTEFGCLLEARTHYLAGAAIAKARNVTDRICEMLALQGDFSLIERLNSEVLEYEVHPDPMLWIAQSHLELTNFDEAQQWYQRAFDSCSDSYPNEKAQALHGLATVNIRLGNPALAREQLHRALLTREPSADRVGQAMDWHQLASIDMRDGKYKEAREGFEAARLLLADQPPRQELQAVWHQIGSLDLREERYPEARIALGHALDMATALGDRRSRASAIQQLGRVDLAEGKHSEALRQFKEALSIRRSVGDSSGEAMSYRRLSEVAVQIRQFEPALRLRIGSYLIHKIIKPHDAEEDLTAVQQQAAALDLKVDFLETLLKNMEQEYLLDRGRSLMKIVAQLN